MKSIKSVMEMSPEEIGFELGKIVKNIFLLSDKLSRLQCGVDVNAGYSTYGNYCDEQIKNVRKRMRIYMRRYEAITGLSYGHNSVII